MWELAHQKSVGQAGRLEIQVRIDVAVFGLNSVGQDRTGQDRQAGKVSVSQSWALIPSSSENLSLVFYDLQLIG